MAIEVEQRLTQEISQGGADGLVHALRQESDYCWRHALARWRWLSEHSGFRNWLGARAEAIGADVIDENARNDFARRLPVAILAFNARLALSAAIGCSTEDARRHRELMREAGFTAAAIEEAVRVAVEPLMRRIRERLETFRDEINRTNKAALVGPTRGLIDEVTPALEALDRLLPNDDGPLTDLHEMLAETANIAQVAGSKETGDLAFAVDVLTRIERHARSATLKKTLARNIQITRCFFCKMRPGSTGCAVPVGLYKITAVNPTRKGVSYSKSAIQVPRCQECQNAHRSGKGKTAGGMNILPASKASESVLVTEEYPNGWKLGSEPSDFEVQQAIQQDISSLLGQLSRRGPRT
jgi:hypothetical protein